MFKGAHLHPWSKGPKDLPGIPGDAPDETTRAGMRREEGSIHEVLKRNGKFQRDGESRHPINLISIGPDRARFDRGGRKMAVRPAAQ